MTDKPKSDVLQRVYGHPSTRNEGPTPSNKGRRTNGPDAKTGWGDGSVEFIDQGEVLRAPDVTRTNTAPRTNKDAGNTRTSSGTGGK